MLEYLSVGKVEKWNIEKWNIEKWKGGKEENWKLALMKTRTNKHMI